MLNRQNRNSSSRVLVSISRIFLFISVIMLAPIVSQAQDCNPRGPSSFTFRPQHLGDSITVGIGLSPCETVALTETHNLGSDGNRGTNVKMTYLNSAGQVLHSEQFWGFFSGGNSFPESSSWPFPWVGTVSANWRVASLKIESVGAYGKGSSNQEPEYDFNLSFATRPGYNTAGDSFATAANASLPSTYMGSFYDSTDTPSDPGQFFKVRLKCRQAMYVYGTVTGSTAVGASFKIDLYDSNLTLLTQFGWVNIAAYGTKTFNSSHFTNPNNGEADYYIRLKSTNFAVHDFTLNIDEYIGSNSSTNPRTTAPDATGTDADVSSEEYHLPESIDTDVLDDVETELWAKVYRPTDISGGPYPLVMFLHGNHMTCGRSSNPRIDDNRSYTLFGTCPSAAPLLGVFPFISGISASAVNNYTGWVGMKITVGPRPIIVKQLGRMFLLPSANSHEVKIIRADGVEIASKSVTLNDDLGVVSYATLTTPVTLSANTEYYVVSQEQEGGDFWYELGAIPTATISSAAVINGAARSTNLTSWSVNTGSPPLVHGPVDFKYEFTDEPGYTVVPNHLGYEYLANQLASRGYIVASINANRSITAGDGPDDDPSHIYSRGRLVLKHLETFKSWNNGPANLVTDRTLGTNTNAPGGWHGMKITVKSQPLTVHTLGRMFVSGNTGTHTVKIVRVSDGADIGSVSISMTGGTAGSFKYENLASPVTLAANTSYYIVSEETLAGDLWYSSDTFVTASGLATVNGRVTSADGTNWDTTGGSPGFVYGPLDFKFTVLSVNLAGKIDFANVGLMGHSRGGQGVRAAYNLYRDSSIDSRGISIPWSSKISGMTIKGVFEIGPTDFSVPTNSDGSGARYFNADGTAWNVLLPMCDGDVSNLAGVRVFDRLQAHMGNITGIPADNPAKQKSTFTAWGANHNFFNTEWQRLDRPDLDPAISSCAGHNSIFPEPPDGNGSANQRTIGSAGLLAFFRANVGAGASANFNQNFNPLYNVATVASSITTIDRGFTPTPNSTTTKVIYDFVDPPPTNSSHNAVNTNFSYASIFEHEYSDETTPPSPSQLKVNVGNVTWESASECSNFFQVNWKAPNTGESISVYKTLDIRISRKNSTLNGGPTNFQIQLIKADNTPTGASVSLKKYLNLVGPVGVTLPEGILVHSILQTVRIPLTDFTGASLSSIRGVRLVFSDTPTGDIFLANIRLSKVN